MVDRSMKKRLLLMLLGGGLQMALAPVSAQTCRERAESLVSKMTLEEKASLVSGRWFPYGCDPAIGYSVDSDGRWAAGRAEQDEEYLLSVRNLVGVDLESRSGSGNGAWTGPGCPGPGHRHHAGSGGQYLPFGALRA